ncbi:MAG TPA: hypothetical protein VK638_56065 [Edaphobacter sp.]|nr:hypothetical protein [Edaphobacter sp.]
MNFTFTGCFRPMRHDRREACRSVWSEYPVLGTLEDLSYVEYGLGIWNGLQNLVHPLEHEMWRAHADGRVRPSF